MKEKIAINTIKSATNWVSAGIFGAAVKVAVNEIRRQFKANSYNKEIITDPEVINTVNEVANKMGSGKKIKVLNDKSFSMEPNATVNSDIFNDEMEINILALEEFNSYKSLRAVLGHEIAHDLLHHQMKLSVLKGFNAGILLKQCLHLFSKSGNNKQFASTLLGLCIISTSAVLIDLACRRHFELQADSMSVNKLKNHGDMIELLEKKRDFSFNTNSSQNILFSTHPSYDKRIKNIEDLRDEEQSSESFRRSN